MTAPHRTLISTSRGDVRCVHVAGVAAYRVGYPPTRSFYSHFSVVATVFED